MSHTYIFNIYVLFLLKIYGIQRKQFLCGLKNAKAYLRGVLVLLGAVDMVVSQIFTGGLIKKYPCLILHFFNKG